MEWAASKLSKATIRSINGKACKVRYGSKLIELSLEPGKTVVLNGDLVAWKN
jgi:hypothetical protein